MRLAHSSLGATNMTGKYWLGLGPSLLVGLGIIVGTFVAVGAAGYGSRGPGAPQATDRGSCPARWSWRSQSSVLTCWPPTKEDHRQARLGLHYSWQALAC